MPVEIRELVIRAVAASDSDISENTVPLHATQSNKEEVVQECVKQVLRILKKEKER